MVEGQERVLFVGDDFQEGVAEERLVEGQLAAYLPQGFARSIDLRDEGAQQGDFRIEREAFAGDVVGLVVDDAAERLSSPQRQNLSLSTRAAPSVR